MRKDRKYQSIDRFITKIKFNDKVVGLIDKALPLLEELHEELHDEDEPDETKPLTDIRGWLQETIEERRRASIDNYKTIQYAEKL